MDAYEWSILDTGMFAQSLMLAAANRGIASVPQARLVNNPEDVAKILGLDADRRLLLGISLGFEEAGHPMNTFHSSRDMLENWSTFME